MLTDADKTTIKSYVVASLYCTAQYRETRRRMRSDVTLTSESREAVLDLWLHAIGSPVRRTSELVTETWGDDGRAFFARELAIAVSTQKSAP